MNDLPTDWLDQLKTEYPKRSGPMRWPRVFLPVRRALMDVTWSEIIEGIKRYKAYAIASGKEGSDFVIGPESFFKDEIYKEQFEHKAPQDPKIIEARAKEADFLHRAMEHANLLDIKRYPHESAAALETRCMLAETQRPSKSICSGNSEDMASRVTSLTARMRMK